MLKNILNFSGAQPLSKNEQKTINGGYDSCLAPIPRGYGACYFGVDCRKAVKCSDLCDDGSDPIGC